MKSFIYKTPSLLLSLIAGLLLWASWPPSCLFFFSFFAFALLLIVEEKLGDKKGHYFWHIYLAMFVWNVATSYWVFNATPIGSAAWVLNALFMTLPWLAYRKVKNHYGLRVGLMTLVSCWLTFEWLHFNWELAWPWLALGNIFATTPKIVQWYEFTGTGGGTIWILIINCLFYLMLKQGKIKKWLMVLAPIIVLPILVSYVISYTNIEIKAIEVNFLVVQPNINPYTRDYSIEESNRTLSKLIELGKENTTKQTDFIIYPETSLPDNPWVRQINTLESIKQLEEVAQQTDNGSVVIGADILKLFSEDEELTATARYSPQSDFFYDVYNGSIFIQKNDTNNYYVKSKLVPAVERMPYPKQLRFLQKLAIDLGGVGGSRATQKERTVFTNKAASIGTAICYESVFGDYMNDFVKNGAEILVIITNDGWWKNTSGYKQHLHYARLRAIESRRDIARSANTGVSAFINSNGEIISQTNWWEETTLSGSLTPRNEITFYTKYGDYIYRFGLLFSIIILLITFVKSRTNNFKYRI